MSLVCGALAEDKIALGEIAQHLFNRSYVTLTLKCTGYMTRRSIYASCSLPYGVATIDEPCDVHSVVLHSVYCFAILSTVAAHLVPQHGQISKTVNRMQDQSKQNAIFFVNLRWLINRTRLMDCQIAEKLGIHKVSFSRYFSEQRIPKRTVMEKIEAFFQVSRDDLMDADFIAKQEPAKEPASPDAELTLDEWRTRALAAEYKLNKLRKATSNLAAAITEMSDIF